MSFRFKIISINFLSRITFSNNALQYDTFLRRRNLIIKKYKIDFSYKMHYNNRQYHSVNRETIMKVKGTAIVDLVKFIRKEKSKDWGKYFGPDDVKIIDSIIVPTQWYSGDSFWRISRAVAIEIGEMKEEKAILFGRLSAQSYLKVYKQALKKGEPAASIKKFASLWNSFYDFEGAPFKKTEVEEASNLIIITAHDYPDMPLPDMRRLYFYGLAGYYQEIAAQALEKELTNPKIEDKEDRHIFTIDLE